MHIHTHTQVDTQIKEQFFHQRNLRSNSDNSGVKMLSWCWKQHGLLCLGLTPQGCHSGVLADVQHKEKKILLMMDDIIWLLWPRPSYKS